MFAQTSQPHAPWYIIPSNHKWFRNLAVSQIVAATLEDLGLRTPNPTADLNVIRNEYHEAARDEGSRGTKQKSSKRKKK